MRVVVLGATGNVGTSVLHALGQGPGVEDIVGVARRAPSTRIPGVRWETADVVRDDLVPLLRGASTVIHLAWLIQPSRDRAATRAVNVGGSARVLRAVAEAGVPALVYASSVGAYSPGPKDRRVDEGWPTGGIETSFYSRHKAAVERILDGFEQDNPDTRVVRLRPGLIFKRDAATEIRRYFAGAFVPGALVRPALIPIVPAVDRLRFQAVHSLDVGEAYALAVTRDVRGAFNIAAEPVLDPDELGRILHARPVRVPAKALRLAVDATWRLHLQPTPPGWVDMALAVPLLDTTRAREELGWQPRHSSADALLELLGGMRDAAGAETPPLSPSTSGPLRVREVLTGVGRENP